MWNFVLVPEPQKKKKNDIGGNASEILINSVD